MLMFRFSFTSAFVLRLHLKLGILIVTGNYTFDLIVARDRYGVPVFTLRHGR